MAVIVPLVIARQSRTPLSVPIGATAGILAIGGIALSAVGLALFVSTLRLFVTVGRGTLAPWDPPKHLVVRGPYGFVRNPMISWRDLRAVRRVVDAALSPPP